MTEKPRPTDLSVRLNRLFDAVRPPGLGRPYRSVELERAVRDRGGRISTAYISQLRSGARQNISIELATRIADFFGVDAAYVLGTESTYCAAVDTELMLLRACYRQPLRRLIESIRQLSAEDQDRIQAYVHLLGADQPSGQVSPAVR